MHPARLLLVAPDAPAQSTPSTGPGAPAGRPSAPAVVAGAAVPRPIAPLPPRRERPSLLVAVDDDPSSHAALVWALREAARREATVVAVSVRPEPADDADDRTGAAYAARAAELSDRVRVAVAEAGVRPRVRTAVLDAAVFEALAGAARGADLVVVGRHGKTLLRPAVARTHPVRRIAHPA
jgi:nucleotide-binding universal stress UspA family protein